MSEEIGIWRLRKSVAKFDARYYYDNRQYSMANELIKAARYCSKQIVRIKQTARNFTNSL